MWSKKKQGKKVFVAAWALWSINIFMAPEGIFKMQMLLIPPALWASLLHGFCFCFCFYVRFFFLLLLFHNFDNNKPNQFQFHVCYCHCGVNESAFTAMVLVNAKQPMLQVNVCIIRSVGIEKQLVEENTDWLKRRISKKCIWNIAYVIGNLQTRKQLNK